MRYLSLAGLGLALIACAPARPAAPAPTAAPITTVAPAATTAPGATIAPTVAPTLEPTVAPTLRPEPKIAAPAPRGVVAWHDDELANDAILVSAEDLPSAGGQSYRAWLTGKDGSLFVGRLAPGRAGAQTLNFASPEQVNLLSGFERLSVGATEAASVLSGGLPPQALVHVRHLLVGIPSTPGGIGFGLGLRKETEELLRHAQFLKEALDESNLPLEKLHAEHMINLIEGKNGEHYGDLNGNGKVENPGDGFGLLQNGPQDGYVKGMRDHALLAAAAPDATQDIKIHAGHVDIAGANTAERVTDMRDRSLSILKARTVSETRSDVQRILALGQQTIQGVDLNGDEQIAPIPGEGGVVVAYQHAQLMAAIPLAPVAAQVAAPALAPTAAPASLAPTLAPTAIATLAPTLVPTVVIPTPTAVARAVAQTLNVSIRDNSFSPATVSVPVGSTVVWTHAGQRPHTVTADDASFGTDVLKTGATFKQTFSTAGTYLYYCDLHGGPGSVGMSARVQVVQ